MSKKQQEKEVSNSVEAICLYWTNVLQQRNQQYLINVQQCLLLQTDITPKVCCALPATGVKLTFNHRQCCGVSRREPNQVAVPPSQQQGWKKQTKRWIPQPQHNYGSDKHCTTGQRPVPTSITRLEEQRTEHSGQILQTLFKMTAFIHEETTNERDMKTPRLRVFVGHYRKARKLKRLGEKSNRE